MATLRGEKDRPWTILTKKSSKNGDDNLVVQVYYRLTRRKGKKVTVATSANSFHMRDYQPSQEIQYSHNSEKILCEFCNQPSSTKIQLKAGKKTWKYCGLCCILGCFCGCCLVPCCFDDLKTAHHYCRKCHNKVGVAKNI